MGAGDLDLSVHFLLAFGEVVTVRIPAPDKTWKFDARRDVGIYLGDADDTKRGCLVYMLSTGVVRVSADCIRLEMKDEKLLSAIDSYSTVHQIAVIDRMKVRIIDTVGAYLYQSYPESSSPIYIRIPAKVMSALQIPEDTVYRIKKYIYGLPDSGRAYYLAYAKLLQDAGYYKAKSDPCLFYKIMD